MELTKTFGASCHVVACDVADETVLLDKEQGRYFGLDAVGAQVWRLIAEGQSLSAICDLLEAKYSVSRDVLEHDIRALAGDLESHRLIVPVETRCV